MGETFPDNGIRLTEIVEHVTLRQRFETVVRRAGNAMVIENAWPATASLLGVATVFAATSWAGLWQALPSLGRGIGTALFATAVSLCFLNIADRLGRPTRAQAIARVDRKTGLPHNPARTLEDTMPYDQGPMASGFWTLHQKSLRDKIPLLKSGAPTSRLPAMDPWAIRSLFVLIPVIALAAAPAAERVSSLTSIFNNWEKPAPVIPPPITYMLIIPPAYLAKPAIILTNSGKDELPLTKDFTIPEGSEVMIQVHDRNAVVGAIGGAHEIVKPDAITDGVEKHYIIDSNANIGIATPDGFRTMWRFASEPDAAPSIALNNEPKPCRKGVKNLCIPYSITDDKPGTMPYSLHIKSAESEPAGVKPPEFTVPLR